MTNQKIVPWIEFPTRHFPVADTFQISAIDNFFSSPSLRPTAFAVADDTSDHFPIYLNWGDARRQKKINMKIRPSGPQQLAELELEFLKENWTTVYEAQDANQAATEFERIKDSIIDKCLPTKTIRINPDLHQPWFTQGLRISRATLQQLIIERHQSTTNLERYKTYKSLYNRICRKAEISWTKQELAANRNNTRKIWQLLDKTVNRKRKTGEITSLFKIGGTVTDDPKLIANAFNTQYTTMGPNLAKKFKGEARFHKYLDYKESKYDLTTVSPKTVYKTIEKMGNKTSHGHDLLTNNILKRMNYILHKPLTRVINKSISQSIFPDVWKISRVIPLHKGGDTLNTLNYRPVSLCPVASKILEKVIHRQIYSHAMQAGMIPSNQFGFQEKNRTEHLIQKFLNIITTARSMKKKIIVTFLDFSKAFDTVPHLPFLEKMFSMGFSLRLVHWFQSYLTGRSQYVDYKGTLSDTLAITCGVPQGTCLGPLIFLLYTADLNSNLRHSILLSFADDTTVITIGNTIQELEQKTQKDYAILSDWYQHSRLSLNVKKNGVHDFFRRRNRHKDSRRDHKKDTRI